MQIDVLSIQDITEVNGSFELGETVSLFREKFRLTGEGFDEAILELMYLMLDMSLFGAALIKTNMTSG